MTRQTLASEICPGDPLDLGIVEVVKALMDAGLKTSESCEGGEGHTYRDPTVSLVGGPADGWKALAVCKDLRLPIRSLQRVWQIYGGEPSGPWWYLTFHPDVRDVRTARRHQ